MKQYTEQLQEQVLIFAVRGEAYTLILLIKSVSNSSTSVLKKLEASDKALFDRSVKECDKAFLVKYMLKGK